MIRKTLLATALLLIPVGPALAQTTAPLYLKDSTVTLADAMFILDQSGHPFGTPGNPISIIGSSAFTGPLPAGTNAIGSVTINGTPSVSLTGAPSVSITGTPAVTIGAWPSLPAGTNAIGSVTINGTPSVSLTGTPSVTAAITGTPAVAQSGAWTTGRTWSLSGATDTVAIAGTPAVSISNAAFASTLGTTNGWTPKLANGLTTTVVSVKSSAGQLGMLQCYNANSAQAYVQVFNVASGSVTLGTTTPALSIPIASTSTSGMALANPGINFSTAISIAATTTATGSTAPTTAIDCNVVYN